MKQLFLVILLAANIHIAFSQIHFEPTWESLASRPYPQWFRDAKLGIFIHWGLYSVPAWSGKEQYGEWFLKGLLTGDSARINFQKKVFGKDFRYENYPPLFKAELFDAGEWASLFEKAGAKYVVMVSKHHDGYCLWPSVYSPDWNSMETGPRRDLVGELTEAVKSKGLKMGLYYSFPEWNHPLYRWGTDQPERVHQYVEQHMIPQFRELVATYRPSLLFGDGDWDHPASTWHSAELIAWYFNLVGEEAIVNNRWGDGSQSIGFQTPEYSAGIARNTRPWAEARGMGRSFGLNRNETLDAYLTPEELVHFFAIAVANGGGMTLNVGPYCDGQIPLLQQERLIQLGQWLKINGEAIYGSTMFYKTIEQKEVFLARIDKNIDFNWVRNSPGKPISEDHFNATWKGFIQPVHSEEYVFEANADDEIRVWINNQLIVDNWGEDQPASGGEPRNSKATGGNIPLQAGKRYPIKVEYQEKEINAHAHLYWSSKSTDREIVPGDVLFLSSQGDAHGLEAIYTWKKTHLCFTVNQDKIYAIALEWPEDNKLVLNIDPPDPGSEISLVGRKGTLSWSAENGKVIIDLNPVRIAELPCNWAWVFRIEQK